MTIKPPGGTPLNPSVGVPENAPAGKPRARNIDSARFSEQLPGAEPGIVSQFKRADLNDPQALDKMVRQTIDGLLQNDWSGPAGLSEADRRNIVDFMSADPACQKQVRNWLDKVLK